MNIPFTKIQLIRSSYKQAFEYAVESDQGLRKGELLRLTGPAIFLDKISANGRRYIDESVHAQVAELQPRIAKKALFGVLDHPDANDIQKIAYVKMTDVSHRIDALWYNAAEKTYYVTITVLDTPNGNILKAIHDSGSPIYISLRSILDPSRCIQRNGYTDAYMLALITLDVVSRPGFADAELKAVDVSTEAALAVCEAYNVFNPQIIANMKKDKLNANRQYIPAISMEGFTGVATQPTEAFAGIVKSFIADVLDKLPSKFTASDFAKQYPDSMFDGHVIGLYEASKELMITDVEAKTAAIISLESPADGEFTLADDADVQYYNTEIADNSNAVQGKSGSESFTYPVIATEDYEPSEGIQTTAQNVLDELQSTYAENGFSQSVFNSDIAQSLTDKYGISARIDDEHEPKLLRIISQDGEDGAAIELKEEDDMFIPVQIAEYWKPGSEACEAYAINDNIKLLDASGDIIAEGPVENMGTYGEHKQTIEEEDKEGHKLMTDAGISDDTEVVKIDGNWYYIEDGMAIECDDKEPKAATEADELCTLTSASGDQIVSGVLQSKGTFGELKETIEAEDPQGYANMLAADISDDTVVYKVDDCWYYTEEGMEVDIQEIVEANESTDGFTQQTDGNQPNRKPIDSHYMQTSDSKEGEQMQAQIVDDEDDADKANKEAMAQQMYTIVENEIAQVVEEPGNKGDEGKGEGKGEGNGDDEGSDGDNDDLSKIAEEAQRIFNMPNSKFAGNYAVEHMPAPYKHIWAGLTDAAKATIAKQAENAKVACEADNLKFWANTNFIAIERACLIAKEKGVVATESYVPENKQVNFMKRIFRKS